MMITRPETLDEVGERLAIAIAESGESPLDWARDIYPDAKTSSTQLVALGRIARPGSRPQYATLLRIDNACGKLFLTPPERAYVESKVSS